MDLEKFIEDFASQFDDTDASEIKADTKFRELEEWSSLTALSFIAMVGDEYEVQLKGNEMRAAVTVKDLYNVVKSKRDV